MRSGTIDLEARGHTYAFRTPARSVVFGAIAVAIAAAGQEIAIGIPFGIGRSASSGVAHSVESRVR